MTRRKRDELRENVIIAARIWAARMNPVYGLVATDLVEAVEALDGYEAAALTGAGARSVKGAPETSAGAAGLAEPIQFSTRHQILDLLDQLHDDGMTDDRLEHCLHRPHQTVSSARNWLVEAGWVRDSGKRVMTRSNRLAVVWELTPTARKQLKGGR